jgi:carbonic anhydrase
MTPSESLQRLKEGNARFVAGASNLDWYADLSAGQHPFATILGCSDSRVPPEIVFDQGLGELFVVRVAGNVVGDEILGSLGYALIHLHTPVFVVLGHERCGAVQAALQTKFHGHREQRKIGDLVNAIVPALEGIDPSEAAEQQWQQAVEANVRWAVRQLVATPAGEEIKAGRIQIVGAVYELRHRPRAVSGPAGAAGRVILEDNER